MPKRKRSEGALTQRQIRILLFGDPLGAAGRGFLNRDEELDAWMEHRAELMLEQAGSARPAAYLKFELTEEMPYWIMATCRVFQNGMSENFIANMEREPTLSADPPAHTEFATVESIKALGLPIADLEQLSREFGVACAWHLYRNRAREAAKYEGIGAALRSILRAELPILKAKPQEN
jgi:hypothetical protein